MARVSGIEIVTQEPGAVFALWRRAVLLQARRGVLTTLSVRRMNSVARAQLAAGHALGALLVIEPGAPLPTTEVRAVQRRFVAELTAHPRARMAPVLLGDDVPSQLARSAGRLVASNTATMQRFDAVAPAVEWLTREMSALEVELTAIELTAAIDAVRALAAESA